MYRIIAKINKENSKIKVFFSRKEILNERDINFIMQTHVPGLMRIQKFTNHTVSYVGPPYVNLITFLQKPHTMKEFYLCLAQFVNIFKKVNKSNISLNNLLLDMRYVYISESTFEIEFLYLPLITNHVVVDLRSFFEEFANLFLTSQGEDGSYARKILTYLRQMETFKLSDVENYVLENDKVVYEMINKRIYSQSGFITDKRQEYEQHYMNIPQLNGNEETSILNPAQNGYYENENTTLLENIENNISINSNSFSDDNNNMGTMLLDSVLDSNGIMDDEGTTVLGDTANSYLHFPSLTRQNTKEIISINKPVFRLGKEKSYVDYFINNNDAISRSHADIITRGNRYYIYDQNSTNHTFINNIIVPVRLETELHDGDVIRLANEEFVFSR